MGRDFQIGLKKKKKRNKTQLYFADSVVLCLISQSCLTLFNPMDSSPPGSSVHRDSPGKNTGVGCHALLQGIFPIQGSNPGLLHCRKILYHLSHQGSPSCLQEMNFIYKDKNKLKVKWRRKRYHEKRDDKRVMSKQIKKKVGMAI